jgi:hypothetical protein
MLATDVVVLNDDESICVVFVLPELNVAPLEGNEFPAAKAGAKRCEKEGVIVFMFWEQ